MKIVKFKNGSYGVRTWCFGFRYLDLRSPCFRWALGSRFIGDCQGTKEEALHALWLYTDRGQPIDKVRPA